MRPIPTPSKTAADRISDTDVSRNGTRRSSTDSSQTAIDSVTEKFETKVRYLSINNQIPERTKGKDSEERLIQLAAANTQLQDQVQTHVSHQEDLSAQYADLEIRHAALQASTASHSSEIELLGRLLQEERAKSSGLIKRMEDLQPPDPYKKDDDYFKSAVEDLRYQIKMLCRAKSQILPISQPPPILNGVAGYVLGKLGHKEAEGPNYTFLEIVTHDWANYTRTHEGLKLMLQAYVWRRLIELVFEGDGSLALGTQPQVTCKEVEVGRAWAKLRRELQPGKCIYGDNPCPSSCKT